MTGARVAAAALALALLAAPVLAAGTWQGRLTASAIDSDGPTSTAGVLKVLVRSNSTSQPGMPSTAHFLLTAQHLRLETDQSDPAVVDPTGGSATPFNPQTSAQDYAGAVATGVAARGDYQMEVFPQEGQLAPAIRAETGCASIAPHDPRDAQWSSVPMVDLNRPSSPVDVSQAVQWKACPGGTFAVEGSFVLTLWDWDARLEADGRSTELRSGYDTSDQPGGAALFPHVAKARQQFLFVSGGRLELPAVGDAYHRAYIQDARLSSSSLLLSGASGRLSNGGEAHDVAASLLALEGRLGLSFPPQQGGRSLQVDVAGALDSAEMDGHPLALQATTTVPQGVGDPWLLAALGAAGLVAAPVVVHLARRRSLAVRRVAYLRAASLDLANRMRYDDAAVLARQWAELDREDPEVDARLATICAGRGDLHGAWEHGVRAFERLRHASAEPCRVADSAFDLALIARSLSRDTEGEERERWLGQAQERLAEAVRLCPDLMQEAARHSGLEPLVPVPRLAGYA